MADERTRWREERGRWDEGYGREGEGHDWRGQERSERPGYGHEGRGREGYDYGREYWRGGEERGERGWGGGPQYGAGERYRGREREGRQGSEWERAESDWSREERGYGGYGGRGREDWRYRPEYRGYGASGYGWSEGGRGGYDPRRAAGRGYSGEEGYAGVPGGGFWRDERERYGGGGRGRGEVWGERGYRPDERGWFDRAADEVSSWFGDDEAQRRREMDERRAGQHRGRGPRGYTRSDDRIREDVNDRLTDDPFVDASEIEVTVSGCEVTLSGTVDSRMAKRRAEDIAESVSGVRHVQNNIRVKSRETAWTGKEQEGASFGTASAMGAGTTTAGAGGRAAQETATTTTGKTRQSG